MLSKQKIQIICFIFVLFAVGLNYSNADFFNYEYMYEVTKSSGWFPSMELGYGLLMKIGIFFNLSYSQFLFFYSILPAGLLIIFLNRITLGNRFAIIISILIYCIYPMIFDIIQHRNFLATMIVLNFFLTMIRSNSKQRIFIYTLGVLLAAQIHITALIYLILILVNVKSIKVLSCLVIVLALISSISIKYAMKPILLFFGMNRHIAYVDDMTDIRTVFVFIIYFTAQLLTVVYVNFRNETSPESVTMSNIKRYLKSFNLISLENPAKYIPIKVNMIMYLTIPMILFNINFYRIQRGILIFNITLIVSYFLKMGKKSDKYDMLVYIMNLLFYIISFTSMVYLPAYNEIFLPTFNNYIIDILL